MAKFAKSLLFILLAFTVAHTVNGQVAGSLQVQGDIDKFYPVTFYDGGWPYNVATELKLGRSNVHADEHSPPIMDWKGSLISRFRYHVTNWGHQSNFIDADIRQANSHRPNLARFIAGWRDASGFNSNRVIVIWLRGATSYYYESNYAVNPVVYDGVQKPLPYQEAGGPGHTYKTAVDDYVNLHGITYEHTAYFNTPGNNYFAGSLGIGVRDPKGYKLAVAGNVIAEKIQVKLQSAWPDYVFRSEYKLPSLQDVEHYIKAHGHLPDMPAAAAVEQEGLDVGAMNQQLVKKVEELTLYMIELNKQNMVLKQEVAELKKNRSCN